jgi:polar amino acid transport system substrate-binding protein
MKRLLAVCIALGLLVAAVAAATSAGPEASVGPAAKPRLKPLPALPSEVRSRGKWQIGVKCNTPPFGYQDTNNQNKGYDVEVGREFARFAFGQRSAVDFTCTTTANRIPTLTAKRVDIIISTVTWTAEREQTIDFSLPYYGATGRLLVRNSVNVSTLKAWLPGKRIVTTPGSIYDRWVKNCFRGTQLQVVSDPSFGVLSVKNGQADALMYDDAFLVGVAANDRELKMTKHIFLKVPWGIGIRKGETAMKRWVDAAILRMKAQDTFWKILQRTIPRRFHPEFKTYVPRPKITLRYPRAAPAESKCP